MNVDGLNSRLKRFKTTKGGGVVSTTTPAAYQLAKKLDSMDEVVHFAVNVPLSSCEDVVDLIQIPRTARDGHSGIGVYQADASKCDIYLVSEFNGRVLGRPCLYIMVDSITSMITGVSLGYSSAYEAYAECVFSAGRNKRAAYQKSLPSRNAMTGIFDRLGRGLSCRRPLCIF